MKNRVYRACILHNSKLGDYRRRLQEKEITMDDRSLRKSPAVLLAWGLVIILGALMLASPLPASAGTTVNFRTPFNPTYTQCGETVAFSGYAHGTVSYTQDNSGGMHGRLHLNFQNVSGVSTTGTRYRFNGAGSQITNATANGANTFTFPGNIHMVGQGPNNNFVAHYLLHITINSNGEPTAVFEMVDAECR